MSNGDETTTPPPGDTDWQFGMLNDIALPMIGSRMPGRGDMLAMLGELLDESYTQNSFRGTGPYKGIVLRDETENFPAAATNQQTETGENVPMDDWTEAVEAKLTCLRVRIPEIHAGLPIPKTTGDQATPEDKHIIDLYDVFKARQTDGALYPPQPVGAVVWVDYGNKQNFTDPIYLGPLVSGNGPAGANGRPPNSAAGWDCTGKYKRKPGSGDTLSASNVSLKPYQGLPRLQRKPKAESKFKRKMKAEDKEAMWKANTVLAADKAYNETVYEGLKKAWLTKGRHEIKVFFGHIKYNGMDDDRHNPAQRSTLIVAPWYFQADEPWELIYWFHGLKGFSQKNFEGRMMPQINKMIKEKRNFVLVKPELPWSISGTGEFKGALKEDPQKGVVRQTAAWLRKDEKAGADPATTYGGNFAYFHVHVLEHISRHIFPLSVKDNAGNWVNFEKILADAGHTPLNSKYPSIISTSRMPTMTSIFGHSNGGSAIARAAQEGALSVVQPDRIFFSDSDYGWGYNGGGAVAATWKHYVKSSKKKIWLTMLTIPKHTPRKRATSFFAKTTTPAERSKHYVYHIETTKSHAWCGHNALSVVSTEHIEAVKKEKAAAATPPKPASKQPDPEKEENKVETTGVKEGEDKAQGTSKPGDKPKESPKIDKTGANPPPQGPPAPASAKPKQSDTKDPPKPDFKLAPATPYKENRVSLKEFDAILDKKSDRLADIGNGQKAHVLVAKRWEAMKKAAIADGLPDIRVSSGWRRHRWATRAAYTQYLETKVKEGKYKSVREGKAYIAYDSPHETGLALDIVGHGLDTNSGGSGGAAKAAQRKKHKESKLGKWLIANAHKYGFTPYAAEVWHYEVRMPLDAYVTGKEYTDKFAVRTLEAGKKPGEQNVGKTTSGTGAAKAPCVRTGKSGRGGGGFGGGGTRQEQGDQGMNAGMEGLGKRLYAGRTRRCNWIGPGEAERSICKPMYYKGQKVKATHPAVAGKHCKSTRELAWDDKHAPERYMKEVRAFVIHEAAGWAHNIKTRQSKQTDFPGCGIPYWHLQDGNVMQTCHPGLRRSHCSNGSGYSTATEMMLWGPMYGKKALCRQIIGGGEHVVGPPGVGDITYWGTEKDDYNDGLGKGTAGFNYRKGISLASPALLNSLWDTIASLAKRGHPKPTKEQYPTARNWGTTKMAIPWPLQFPCIDGNSDKIFFAYWNGSPIPHGKWNSDWWRKNVAEMRGVFCHGNVQAHPDGFQGLAYIYARAKRLSHADAYYYMVGCAVTSRLHLVPAKGGNSGKAYAAPKPSAAMIARGKKKYPYPLTAKTYLDFPGKGRRGEGWCLPWYDAHTGKGWYNRHKKKKYAPGVEWWDNYVKKHPTHIGKQSEK